MTGNLNGNDKRENQQLLDDYHFEKIVRDLKSEDEYAQFEPDDVIEGKGQFSIRGGIVDIAVNSKSGVRIELWGDEIDSIRKFNILTQRSTDMLEETSIYPAFEYVLENSIDQVCKKIEESKYAGVLNDIAEEDIEQIKSGDYISKIDKYFTFFYNKQESILDYLDKDCIVFLDEISKIKARSENIIKDNETILKGLVEKRKIPIQILEQTMDYIKVIDKTKEKQTIYLENKEIGFTDVQSMHAKRNGYSFSYREVNFFRSSMDLLFEELQKANKKSKQTVVLCGNYDNSGVYERNSSGKEDFKENFMPVMKMIVQNVKRDKIYIR